MAPCCGGCGGRLLRMADWRRPDASRLINGVREGDGVSPSTQSSITRRLTHLKSRTSQMGQTLTWARGFGTSAFPSATDIKDRPSDVMKQEALPRKHLRGRFRDRQ